MRQIYRALDLWTSTTAIYPRCSEITCVIDKFRKHNKLESNGIDTSESDHKLPAESDAVKEKTLGIEISNGKNQSQVEGSSRNTCVVCLGVLGQFADETFLDQIKKTIDDEGFQYTGYLCSLMLPVCIILREHAILQHMKQKFKHLYDDKKDSDVAPIKDVWKWRNGPILGQKLKAPFDAKSLFDITLTFDYKESNRECSFLLSSTNNEAFRKRKKDRRYNKKSADSVYNRANVGKAIEEMKDEEFMRSYQCPPLPPRCEITCDIKCQNENIFVAGRYNKYSRELSQTPWIIEGTRRSESSVEELLNDHIRKFFRHSEQKFSSSGREDVDVRMLGNGRPFVLELVNPRCRSFTQEQMNKIQESINAATTDIQCRDLQIVTKEETDILKQGEIDKVKLYRALCWTNQPISDQQLDQLSILKDLKIFQKTPVRVLHRRPLATRDKLIHSMEATRVDDLHFNLDLSTQAGTYIKEFVHGDLGRTRPNLSSILGTDCDILELDVMAVELDWPKKIPVESVSLRPDEPTTE
ncbi:tRNA pseudouridine synthase Pus10-like isoform X2 [Dreissena polymorpha]|uniref:tRNA pseudouridine synthase Pus10-like isoform X2 n=1 Tax=Dreissena polymorpha TaxID=45954 RepID=UPI00226433F0|nr:tRNA pseudouridine synthase Pus10-like isoform X2 [Dreissena polymorpha]